MEIQQAWIEINGRPVEAYAEPSLSLLNIETGQLVLGFKATTAELNALALGQKYEVVEKYEDTTLLGAIGKPGIFKVLDQTGRSGYQLQLDSTKIYAYKLFESQDSKGEEVAVVNEITGSNQLVILDSGKIKVSPNLFGRQIRLKVPVVYPKIVLILNGIFDEKITARVITWVRGEKPQRKLLSLFSDLIIPKKPSIFGTNRTITLAFDKNQLLCQDLSV